MGARQGKKRGNMERTTGPGAAFAMPGSMARQHDRAVIAKVVERWAERGEHDFTLWIDAADVMWAQYAARVQPETWRAKARATPEGATFHKMNRARKTCRLWIKRYEER